MNLNLIHSENVEQRIEIIMKNPNALFEKWLMEWIKDAESKNSKSKYTLLVALESLKKFPLPLSSGRDCAILKGFGPTLCSLIDKKLEEFKKENNLKKFNKQIEFTNDVNRITKSIQKNRCIPNDDDDTKFTRTKSNLKKIKSKSKNNFDADDEKQIILNFGNFEIVLLVDTQETTGKTKKTLDETRMFLETNKIFYEIRRLSVGDFMWVCRDLKTNDELCLPYIIERKRMDDFAGSIRDGRFHEQKFRLRECGLEYLFYLIESYGSNQHIGLPMTTLLQAAVNTQIHNKFEIKFTDSHKDSMMYISCLTKILIKKFKDKTIISTRKADLQPCDLNSSILGFMKFTEFQQNSAKTKNVTIKEIFLKQLLQLKSLSVDKAVGITDVYPTPRSLISAYEQCETNEEAENLLTNIACGKLSKVGINREILPVSNRKNPKHHL